MILLVYNLFPISRERGRNGRDNEDRYVNTAPPYDAKLRPSDKVQYFHSDQWLIYPLFQIGLVKVQYSQSDQWLLHPLFHSDQWLLYPLFRSDQWLLYPLFQIGLIKVIIALSYSSH